jgi:hypothetical protein
MGCNMLLPIVAAASTAMNRDRKVPRSYQFIANAGRNMHYFNVHEGESTVCGVIRGNGQPCAFVAKNKNALSQHKHHSHDKAWQAERTVKCSWCDFTSWVPTRMAAHEAICEHKQR